MINIKSDTGKILELRIHITTDSGRNTELQERQQFIHDYTLDKTTHSPTVQDLIRDLSGCDE